mgnify:CR=1 FL=1
MWRGWCRVGGHVGYIQYPEQVKFPVAPIRCNKSFCHCNFDIMCKKVLPENRYEIIDDEDDPEIIKMNKTRFELKKLQEE